MIDEKKLIEEIEERCRYWENCAAEYDETGDEVNMDICDGKAIELHTIIKHINEQPKVGEWIPCSERLPEEDGIYIIDDREFNSPWVHTAGFKVSSKSWYDIYEQYEDGTVIAWQPLPEPWKGEV